MAYTPNVWKDGDRITAEKLNNMEAGIQTASEGGGGSGNVYCAAYDTIVVLDRAEFNALPVKNPRTKYEIRG